jgi:tRNA(Ile)-lysidine synthase
MLEFVAKIIQSECELTNNDSIVVGVSGGVDSMTLLDIMHRLGFPVIAAYFDHRIRIEAEDDAKVVREFALSCNIPYVSGLEEVPEFSERHGLSIEEAGRILRYQFLFSTAEKYQSKGVAVAHNANDQVETLLMHLLRGAGLDGLKGMPVRSLPNLWSDKISLIRPLLRVWRKDIEAYQKEHKIQAIFDCTNDDKSYFRNRIRHELVPVLETYNPGVKTRLNRTAEIIGTDFEYLEQETQKAWESITASFGEEYVSLPRDPFLTLHLSLQRRIVRKSISILRPGARDIDYAMVERVLDFIETPSSSNHADIGLKLQVTLENGIVFILDWDINLPDSGYPKIDGELKILVPGEHQLSGNCILSTIIIENVEQALGDAKKCNDLFQAWMDLSNPVGSIIVRGRSKGERYVPLGMDGKSIKLSDLMINMKIPQRLRDTWPLLCVGDEIVWVPGSRISDTVKINQGTPYAVHVHLHQV